MEMSDHLTMLNAYNAWQDARKEGFAVERKFCYDNFLSGKTLGTVTLALYPTLVKCSLDVVWQL